MRVTQLAPAEYDSFTDEIRILDAWFAPAPALQRHEYLVVRRVMGFGPATHLIHVERDDSLDDYGFFLAQIEENEPGAEDATGGS